MTTQVELKKRQFTVDQYHRMAEAGIFEPGERLELVDGVIYEKYPVHKPKHFSTQQYERMGQANILGEDDRVELLEGEIVEMSPIGSRHVLMVGKITATLNRRLASDALVICQSPVALTADSEPQPDIAVLRLPEERYKDRLAKPAETLLIIEVADTTVDFDRGAKGRLYASAGIREYWVVNLPENMIEVYRRPASSGYATKRTIDPRGTLRIQALPKHEFSAAEWLA